MLTHLRLQPEASSAAAQHLNAHGSADAGHLQTQAAATNAQDEGASSCCIGCFRLMPPPPETMLQALPEGSDDSADSPEPELLCASCILRLAGKSNTSLAVHSGGGGSGVLSPLPKLSLLVKAEAKCQDQMQLLRSQQEVLKQQRESLEAVKRAKEEALAAERELARQRRKHFLMIQERRKRDEELKFQQLQGDEQTSRSEQEGNAGKTKKKPNPPKAAHRRKSEPTAEPSEENLPHLATPMSKHDESPYSHTTTSNDNVTSAEARTSSLYERRQQMMACYSQDLSPLVHGRKPRRLPFPKPVAAVVPSGMIRRRQASDNNAHASAVAIIHRNKNQQKGKSPASKVMKLRPLEEEKQFIKTRPQQSNQFEDFHARGNHETPSKLSLQFPRRPADHSAPLTAEIRPVSWANDLLPQDDSLDEVDSLILSAPLHSVAEDLNDDGSQFTMFPLQHKLPIPTFPPSKPESRTEVVTKVPRWEYSAERLSSLLEKYNVSVSAVTTATSAPKL
ncbi:hypothetical protein F442_06820 [Phytophthora nicotianae P10297]|uniref:Uncharacterized protein n=1 Tax=Phytophthora nicotianae P10297 TaxID=1317064 RepID=W2ZI33_PHYNI|nr:hypothetical protein F442_06820 [Phytophthora nicotianae P10297]